MVRRHNRNATAVAYMHNILRDVYTNSRALLAYACICIYLTCATSRDTVLRASRRRNVHAYVYV